MSSEFLTFDLSEHVATITLNRPERKNAMTHDMYLALMELLRDCNANPEVRVVVLTGAGGTFCAGADLKERAAAGGQRSEDKSARTVIDYDKQEQWWTMSFDKPMIAAVDGFAMEAGFELALMCDIRICTPRAVFSLPAVSLGFVSGGAGPQRLARYIPQSAAMEMVLTAGKFDAGFASRSGLVSRVVDAAELAETARNMAVKIAGNAPLAVRAGKEMVLSSLDQTFDEAMRLSVAIRWAIGQTDDAKEGPKAFAEKRKPEYLGK